MRPVGPTGGGSERGGTPRSCVWSGASLSSEQVAPQETIGAQPRHSRSGLSARWFLLIGLVIVGNIAAFIVVPPFPREGAPGDACAFPVCFIDGTLEFPAPHTVIGRTPAGGRA